MLGQKLPAELDAMLQGVYATALTKHIAGEDSTETAKLVENLSATIDQYIDSLIAEKRDGMRATLAPVTAVIDKFGSGLRENAVESRQQEPSSEVAAGAEALLVAMESVRCAAVMLSPIVPGVAAKVYQQLGYSEDEFAAVAWDDARWGGLTASMEIPKAKPVFQRMEAAEAETAAAV